MIFVYAFLFQLFIIAIIPFYDRLAHRFGWDQPPR